MGVEPPVDGHGPAGGWAWSRRWMGMEPPVDGHGPAGGWAWTRRWMGMEPPVDGHGAAGGWAWSHRWMGMEPPVDGHGPAGSILTSLCTRASSRLYVPVLQSRLDRFRDAWNSHRLRSESNRSLTQMWRDGMLASQGSGHTATDPDVERRHASEPGLWTHSHRGGVRWTDGRPPPTSRSSASRARWRAGWGCQRDSRYKPAVWLERCAA